jgi:hypothetical protein
MPDLINEGYIIMQATSPHAKRLFLGTSLLVFLFLIPALAACGSGNGTGSSTPTPRGTAGKPGASVTPGILSGVQSCPDATKNPAYWNPFIVPQSGTYKVESVSCAYIMGTVSLQALVTIRHSEAGASLDVYVFNNITKPSPTLIFQLNGLVQGEAKISAYNTVLTAQADELSALNAGKPVSSMTADLFREFKWSASAGTLAQTVFPGIFPDLTRYQAEADQAQVNQGHQPWKLSATQVANALAVSLLNWSPGSTTALLSGGGPHDVSAVVRVRSTTAVAGSITVTLSRLEGNTNGGIWEAIAVISNGMSITSPAPLAQFLNPVKVTGTGNAFEGQIGQVIVLDHLYHPLGQASATGAVGMGQTTFSTTLYFQSSFPAGIQEGVLVLSAPGNANGSIAGEVMEKVLINGALESPFAVLNVDLAVSPTSIAGNACGTTVTFTYTATFHVQVGTAGGTIQFLYTWNNGRASPSGSVTVPPGSPSTVTFSFTTSGTLYVDHTYPGIAQILVTGPNAANSPQIIPAGRCS